MGAQSKKYQFFIKYNDGVYASAASKPLVDTCATLSSLGFENHSATFQSSKKGIGYYASIFKKFVEFFTKIKSGSLIATQYPVPTVSYLFIYFIKLASLRNIKFITIIHDINTLRAASFSDAEMRREIKMLSAYHGIVVHNDTMAQWLYDNGLSKSTKTVALKFFDYISNSSRLQSFPKKNDYTVAFAGHLAKSVFVYDLQEIKRWKFNVYGSDFEAEKNKSSSTFWKGSFSPDEIVYNLEGSFGLVWDGADSNNISTNTFGNYMRYNNPFKFSLYIAAGMPVIAPRSAAIAKTITDFNIGFLIDTLHELNEIEISNEDYQQMCENVKAIQKDVIEGNYLRQAVINLEQQIT